MQEATFIYAFEERCGSHHIDADPDPDPASHFDVDPDPSFHFNADADPAPAFQRKAQKLEKVLK
jgi:hypothetical protein